MRTALRLLAVASAAMLLAGCSVVSGPEPTRTDSLTDVGPDPNGTTVEGPPNVEEMGNAAAWCALAPPDLIDATLGLQLRAPLATFTSAEVTCDYLPVNDGDPGIVVRFLLGYDRDTFADYRDEVENVSEPSSDLAGVGDEAFYRRSEFGELVSYVVTARKGSVVLLVDAPSSLDEVTSLVSQVLAQLA